VEGLTPNDASDSNHEFIPNSLHLTGDGFFLQTAKKVDLFYLFLPIFMLTGSKFGLKIKQSYLFIL